MFTVEQIEFAHSKVKTGAEFPKYIQEIKELGVISFETWVIDSQTEYFGLNNYSTRSKAKYQDLNIADVVDSIRFKQYLKIHQQGETDYFTFCNHCAETGIEKWIVDLNEYTCTYYDKSGQKVLTENVPK